MSENASEPERVMLHQNGVLHEVREAGLTKREAFAMAAMQGYLANSANGTEEAWLLARWSVECADALLFALHQGAQP